MSSEDENDSNDELSPGITVAEFEPMIQVRDRPDQRYDEDGMSVSSHSTHYRQTHGFDQQPAFEVPEEALDYQEQSSVSSVELMASDDEDDFFEAVRQREMELSPTESVTARPSVAMKSHLDEYTDSSHRSRSEANITEHFQVPELQLETPVVYDTDSGDGDTSSDEDNGESQQDDGDANHQCAKSQ